MTTKETRLRRLLAGAGALALALGGVVGTAAAANAAEGSGYPPPEGTGSLTLHKHVKAGDTTPPTGAPLEGVSFSVQQVGTGTPGSCTPIDLSTPAGWASVEAAIDGFNDTTGALPAGFCLVGTATPVTTGEDGATPTLTGLKGLYVVKETDPGPNLISEPAAPFLVTVPMPVPGEGGAADSWDFSVDAYPKNVLTTIDPEKTVGETDSLTPDAIVDWTISAPVPAAAFPYNNIQISDVPAAGHEFVAFTSVQLNGTELEGPGEAEPDYTVSGSTITLTAAGLAKVNAIVTGTEGEEATITVELTTKVTGTVVGELENDANVTLNGTTTPVDPPSTNWGKLIVLKHKAGNEQGTLQGAQFAVYEKTGADCAASVGGTPVATGTSGASGTWEQVLWVSNLQADETAPTSKDYCLVETAAPAGYILDSTPRLVTITAAGSAVTTYKFPNQPVDGPELPLTGSNGAMAMMIGGFGLLAVAGGVVLTTRRRAAAKQ